MSYRFKRLTDPVLINTTLKDPELFDRISESTQDPDDHELCVDDSIHWIGKFYNDTLIGISQIHHHNQSTGVIHINVLSPYRKDHGLMGGIMLLEYAILHCNYDKYIAEIPIVFPDVMGFAAKCGFIIEGVNRKSVRKGGILVDQIMYGITRDELIDSVAHLKTIKQ